MNNEESLRILISKALFENLLRLCYYVFAIGKGQRFVTLLCW